MLLFDNKNRCRIYMNIGNKYKKNRQLLGSQKHRMFAATV